jgi:anti-sigma factor RsiW
MRALSNHVENNLAAYLDGQLSPAEAERVASHLQTCAQCRQKREDVRFSAKVLGGLPRVAAPDSLWNEIEQRMAGARPESTRSWSPRLAWGLAAAMMLFAFVAFWQVRPQRPPSESALVQAPSTEFDLGAYLAPVKAAPIPASYQAITRAPDAFAPLGFDSQAVSPKVTQREPLAGFRLLTQRARRVGNGLVVQLVYGNGEEAFSVFVAPPGTKFCYGQEYAVDADVGGVQCSKVDCPLQQTYAFRAGESYCALVSKSLDEQRAAIVMQHFMSAL